MSPFSRLLPLALLLVSRAPLLAADGGAPVSAGYHLKRKSIFTISETARPPFWPIGYSHQTHVENKVAAPVVDFKLDPDAYSLTSILMGSPSVAIINGRQYAEGEFLRMPRNRVRVEPAADPSTEAAKPQPPSGAKIRVAKVLDGSVILEAGAQRVTVPLRRPTLQLHKPDDSADILNQ